MPNNTTYSHEIYRFAVYILRILNLLCWCVEVFSLWSGTPDIDLCILGCVNNSNNSPLTSSTGWMRSVNAETKMNRI